MGEDCAEDRAVVVPDSPSRFVAGLHGASISFQNGSKSFGKQLFSAVLKKAKFMPVFWHFMNRQA
jgi:hypothetical protein